MDRTTYWGYSLSWYNLAGERAKWWDQIKRKGGKRIERRDWIKEKKRHFYILQGTFCRQPNFALGPPSGDRLWVRITLSLHQSHHPSFALLHPILPKHSRRQTCKIRSMYYKYENKLYKVDNCWYWIPNKTTSKINKSKFCAWSHLVPIKHNLLIDFLCLPVLVVIFSLILIKKTSFRKLVRNGLNMLVIITQFEKWFQYYLTDPFSSHCGHKPCNTFITADAAPRNCNFSCLSW